MDFCYMLKSQCMDVGTHVRAIGSYFLEDQRFLQPRPLTGMSQKISWHKKCSKLPKF